MNESDDEAFLNIFNHNNLEEVLSVGIDLQIQDLQNGLASVTAVAAFLSEFLVDFFEAIAEDRPEDAPKLTQEAIVHLSSLFDHADCFLGLIELEYDQDPDDDDEEED
jgi:hypothetical protein